MVSSGGSEVGVAKLTGEVLDIMTRLPMTVEKLTGVNISQVTTCLLDCTLGSGVAYMSFFLLSYLRPSTFNHHQSINHQLYL